MAETVARTAGHRGPSLLTVRGLTRPGLAPVDLDLAAGECVAVLGPSGGGKTMLLRAIADLDPNEGEVSLDGAVRAAMPAPAWRRQVGYLAAESGWWADRVGVHFADAKAARPLVTALGLPAEALDWPVARCSTGERQRLALARLLVQEPRVLLLDEPSSGLDDKATGRAETLIRERIEAGAAALVVTHDERQADRLARRRLTVADGHVREERAA